MHINADGYKAYRQMEHLMDLMESTGTSLTAKEKKAIAEHMKRLRNLIEGNID